MQVDIRAILHLNIYTMVVQGHNEITKQSLKMFNSHEVNRWQSFAEA